LIQILSRKKESRANFFHCHPREGGDLKARILPIKFTAISSTFSVNL